MHAQKLGGGTEGEGKADFPRREPDAGLDPDP